MSRQKSQVEFNKFTAGLITDANPLTFPDNASVEEENFVLNIDGSRKRRFGIDYEEGFQEVYTNIQIADTVELGFTSYKWKNAGGDSSKSILVVQTANELRFFDLDSKPVSANKIYEFFELTSYGTHPYSYSVVDGLLVVCTGEKNPLVFEYHPSTGTVTQSRQTLYIRDLFGVADVYGTTDLLSGEGVQFRPPTKTDSHVYNLRNQSWAYPRLPGSSEVLFDPFEDFFNKSGSKYPSNADSVLEALYADSTDTDNRTIERFFAEDLIKNPVGSSRAPWGHFVIDALERGTSRLSVEFQNRVNNPALVAAVASLPEDKTPGGPTVSAGFAGRAWFAGFSGEVVNGDSRSPRMSSYVMFSSAVSSPADIGLCYQNGDPTSQNSSDLVATDGGFLRLDGAHGIIAMIDVGTGLIVLARNGVWRISGGRDKGFSATGYEVSKISDHGVASAQSVTLVDNTIMFWGDDAIYHVTPNQFGDWEVKNISFGRIQSWFDAIALEDKVAVKGFYDTYERKVRWVIHTDTTSMSDETMELVLDIGLQAFYVNRIKQLEGTTFPRVVGVYVGEPYQVVTNTEVVEYLENPVLADGEDVNIVFSTRGGASQHEAGYIVITRMTPTLHYTFAQYTNRDWVDWKSVDDVGVDAAAFMVTGWTAGQDFQRFKQAPYVTVHMKRTETGYEDLGGGDLALVNPSSCKVQFRWDWADRADYKRWGREFQAYRFRRHLFPGGVGDDPSNGFEVISTRNKVRGRGRSLAVSFKTDPGHDLHLYGWSMTLEVENDV